MLLPLLYFEATEAVLLYLVSGVALKVETSRWLSSGKLVAPKEDNIQKGLKMKKNFLITLGIVTGMSIFCSIPTYATPTQSDRW